VYSSFLRHAEVAAKTHNLKTVNILVELRRRKMAGGQEDMIVDVTMNLFKRGVHDQLHAEPTVSEASWPMACRIVLAVLTAIQLTPPELVSATAPIPSCYNAVGPRLNPFRVSGPSACAGFSSSSLAGD
jgi:hypothetical protein